MLENVILNRVCNLINKLKKKKKHNILTLYSQPYFQYCLKSNIPDIIHFAY